MSECCDPQVIGPNAPPSPAADAALALIIENLECASTVQVRDLVVADLVTPGAVVELTSNATAECPTGVLGIVYLKRDATHCDVLLQGSQEGFTGLTTGTPLWIQADGTIGATRPVTEILQHLGYAASTTKIAFMPKTAIRLT